MEKRKGDPFVDADQKSQLEKSVEKQSKKGNESREIAGRGTTSVRIIWKEPLKILDPFEQKFKAKENEMGKDCSTSIRSCHLLKN